MDGWTDGRNGGKNRGGREERRKGSHSLGPSPTCMPLHKFLVEISRVRAAPSQPEAGAIFTAPYISLGMYVGWSLEL